MSQFVTDLWESIFTPGPTPSLLIATNATFACLQVLLALLLVATYSVHFIVLSFLCGGLWWSINWFAAELRAGQDRELRQQNAAAARKARQLLSSSSDGDGDDTEVEATGPLGDASGTKRKNKRRSQPTPATIAASTEIESVQGAPELQHRPVSTEASAGARSGPSTEDEWEKVSETEKDK